MISCRWPKSNTSRKKQQKLPEKRNIRIFYRGCSLEAAPVNAVKIYKPGSVLTAIYLAPQLLTGSSRLLGTVGQTFCPSTALLRDRVYIVKPMLPWAGCALTAPFHPCLVDSPMEALPFPQAEKIARHGESTLSHQTRFRWVLMGALFGGGGGISLLHLS